MIDREQASCSEQRGEGYTDHFRTIMAGATLFIEAFDIGSGSRRLCLESLGRDYSLSSRSLCKFGTPSKVLQRLTR